jgi:hypothetical protein
MKGLIFSLLLLLLCSCNSIFYNVAGLKKSKNFKIEKLPQYCEKYNIDYNYCYTLNTLEYKLKLENLKEKNPELFNLLSQPLQIKVFNPEGKSIGFLANCQVGGFPNLKWNRFNSFQSFPPDFTKFNSIDTVFALNNELKLLNKVNKNDIHGNPSNRISLIVYWSYLMGRQSKRLIKLLNEYQDEHSNQNIRIFYVNIDSLYL